MQSKNVLMLLGATAIALVAAFFSTGGGSASNGGESARSKRVFEALQERVNDVAEVTASDRTGTVTVKKDGGRWVLVERGGFPVAFEKVQEAVLALARLEIEEPKTKKPENHAVLGVEDPTAEDSESKLVELKTATGEVLAALIVGDTKQRERSSGVFVRRAGEDQVYLCGASFDIDSDPTSWLEKEILRIDRKRVSSVRITHADGQEVLLERSTEDEAQFDLVNLPEGRELKFAGVATGAGTALAYLALDDVRPVGEVDFDTAPLARSVYRCADGLIVEARTATFEDKSWIHLSASYEQPIVVGPVTPVDASGDPQGDTTEDIEASEDPYAAADTNDEPAADDPNDPARVAEVQAEAAELNERLSAWAFAIPEHKADVIARPMSELLKEPEPGAPAAGRLEDAGDDSARLSLESLLNPAPPAEEPAIDPVEEPTPAPADDVPDDVPADDGGS